MNKVLKIIMWIVVLSVIYIWFSTVFESCGKKATNITDDIVEGAEALVDDVEEGVDDISEELFEDEEIDYSDDENIETIEETVDEIIEEEEVDPEPPARYTKNTSSSSSNSSSSSGSYMLIAGNYLVESNASSMVRKLRELGYGSAEIAVFDNSPYHTVVAKRYTEYSTAFNASSNLKDKGIECYVKKRT